MREQSRVELKQSKLLSNLANIVLCNNETFDAMTAKPTMSSNDVIIHEAARLVRSQLLKLLFSIAERNLTKKQKEIFYRAHQQGLSSISIAQELGLHYRSVEVQQHGRHIRVDKISKEFSRTSWGGYLTKLEKRCRLNRHVKNLLKMWKNTIITNDVQGCLELLKKEDTFWDQWKIMEDDKFVGDLYKEKQ